MYDSLTQIVCLETEKLFKTTMIDKRMKIV